MYLTVPACGRKILITGVSCVGKSSIGRRLAEILNCAFCDLDVELERHFRMPISRLKALSLTGYSFRQKASRVLGRILQENRGGYLIVALPPSGLCDWYRKVIKKHGAIVIALSDTAENILRRIVFYDDDSNRIEKVLDERGKALYLREIRKDIGCSSASNRAASKGTSPSVRMLCDRVHQSPAKADHLFMKGRPLPFAPS